MAKGYILLMLGIPFYPGLRWRREDDRVPTAGYRAVPESPEVDRMPEETLVTH